jgi:hypothetical protein
MEGNTPLEAEIYEMVQAGEITLEEAIRLLNTEQTVEGIAQQLSGMSYYSNIPMPPQMLSSNSLDSDTIDALCAQVNSIISKQSNEVKETCTQKEVKQDIDSFIEDFSNIVTGFYGKELSEINVDKLSNGITVIIKYPEIQVTNEFDDSHIIKDLFLSLLFRYGFETSPTGESYISYRFISLSGRRSTFTVPELLSGYVFSHISSYNNLNWSSFCLGDASPISLELIKLRVPTRYDSQLFFTLSSLFFLLDSYVRWESIEGGPYINMRNIEVNAENSIGSAIDTTIRRDYALSTNIVKVIASSSRFSEEFNKKCVTATSKGIYIDIDSFIEFTSLLVPLYDEVYHSSRFFLYNKKTRVVTGPTNLAAAMNYKAKKDYATQDNNLLFTFNGEEVRFKIILEDEGEVKEQSSDIIKIFNFGVIQDSLKIILKLYYNNFIEKVK